MRRSVVGDGRVARGPLGHLLQRVLAVPLGEAVQVEVAVEVVGLVLEAAREVPGAAHLDRVAVLVLPGDLGVLGPRRRGVGAGDGEAALVGVVEGAQLGGQVAQLRVAHDADVPDALVVLAVVDEDLEAHADLVGGEPHALGGALAREHVVHELRQLGPELGDVRALLVQHGVPDDGDRQRLPALPVGALPLLGVGRVDHVALVVDGEAGRLLRHLLRNVLSGSRPTDQQDVPIHPTATEILESPALKPTQPRKSAPPEAPCGRRPGELEERARDGARDIPRRGQQTSSRSRHPLASGRSATHVSRIPRTSSAGAATPHSRSVTHRPPAVACPSGPGAPGSLWSCGSARSPSPASLSIRLSEQLRHSSRTEEVQSSAA
ncbi:putative polypeptide deformylase [Streptomyces sp. Tu6071]|nr:putative polypeptide deformylase [Streptomyces sp. Tu6071]